MKRYDLVNTTEQNIIEYAEFYTLTEAKKWMKSRPNSRGYITKIYSDGTFEPCGEINPKGNNATKMSNQKTYTY